MKKTRILFGLEAAAGGALKHLSYLVTHLDRERFDITVIISPRSEESFEVIENMRQAGACVILVKMFRDIQIFRDIKGLWKIYRHMSANRYDVVHAHSSKAGFYFRVAAWLNRIPCIYTPHCFYYQSKKGLPRKVFAWIERALARITKYIVVSLSEFTSAAELHIAAPGKLLNINNAIKLSDYSFGDASAIKKEMGIVDGRIVIGAIGRLVEQKDWITYIYAAAEVLRQHQDAVFLIVGGGDLNHYLTSLIRNLELEDKIMLTGHYDKISNIYTVIDIFVNTSLWEGLPYVLLEAMWYKRPIITTNLGYDNIITDKENGYLIPIRDPAILTRKILELIRNETSRKLMGEKSRNVILNDFSFRSFVTKHEQLYTEVCRRT